MDPADKNFGVRLRSLIERKGMTVAEFSTAYGIGESQAFNWLKLTKPPPAKHWLKLSEFFGVSEYYIITGNPEEPFQVIPEDPNLSKQNIKKDERFGRMGTFQDALPMHLTPGYIPPAREPTKEQIIRYVEKYLQSAEQTPGGLGHAWFQIRKHLDLNDLKKLQELPPL